MSVTKYTPGSDNGCSYNYAKLKDVVYLVSAEHLKDVHIDEGNTYIDGLTELPLRINGFNIEFTETDSLDERYKFTKKLQLSMNGYVNSNTFEGLYYAIIETIDGTYYMINVDFPSKVTYTYHLGQDTNQTDFTFSCQSNFPTLVLESQFEAVSPLCLGYNINGIQSLKLVEKDYAVFDSDTKALNLYGGKELQEIKYMGNSCALQEVYDGTKVTDTITFNIGFDSYKPSWHYNLLEFLYNLYVAKIVPKSDDNEFFCGFNYGLRPSYEIHSTTDNNSSDYITVTLVEESTRGLFAAVDSSESHKTQTKWRYVKYVGNIKCFRCVGISTAQYLVQQQVDGLGNPTGKYRVMEGYENLYPYFDIIGTFDTAPTFVDTTCSSSDGCELTTDMNTISFDDTNCKSYTLESTCDWNISNLPDYITVTPNVGAANEEYNISVCNSLEPSDSIVTGTFFINYGVNTKIINVRVSNDTSFVTPSSQDINCLSQNVTFYFEPNCPISIATIDSSLSYTIGSSTVVFNVPRNYSSESGKTWAIVVQNCNNQYQTIYINQDKTYEKWVATTEYLCIDGNSYIKEIRYTGTTSTNINTLTGEYRAGTLIESGDTRCSSSQTRWSFLNHYYCIDGTKYKALEEEISYDNGSTWNKTGVTNLGESVQDTDDFCSQAATYEWRQSIKWQCGT